MWRQGDIFFSKLPSLPEEAKSRPLPHVTLAHGELTGHSHRVEDPATAALFAGPIASISKFPAAGRASFMTSTAQSGSTAAATAFGASGSIRRSASLPWLTERRERARCPGGSPRAGVA